MFNDTKNKINKLLSIAQKNKEKYSIYFSVNVKYITEINNSKIENRGLSEFLSLYELDEILNVADRIAVMYEGRIVDVLDTKETNETELGLLMAGSTREQVRAKEQEAL